MSQRSLRLLAALVSAFTLAGCYRAPPPSRFPTADAAFARMRDSQSCSRGLSGEAKLDYFGEDGRVRGSVLYLASVPDRVRLDVFSPFGATLSTLTSDGQTFALFDLQKKSFLRGPANACNLQRFTRVPIPPRAFVELLLGQAPVLVHEPSGTSIEWDSGSYLIHVKSRNLAEEWVRLVPLDSDWSLEWPKQRVRVLEVKVNQAGAPLYRVELEGHAPTPMAEARLDPEGIDPPLAPSGPTCHVEVPRRVHFVVGDDERDLVLVSHDVAQNPPLPPHVFEQQPPSGVKVGYSQCSE